MIDGANDATMDSQSYTLPSKTADWFDMDTIADIERQSLPEFFRGVYPSKTPNSYKEYRDFMIKLYRMNPQTYITATSKLTTETFIYSLRRYVFSLPEALVWGCLCHSARACVLGALGPNQLQRATRAEAAQAISPQREHLLQSLDQCDQHASLDKK